ncbi:MAG: hypothetical protein WBF38_01370 [Nitrosotalea sp.]
MKYQCTFCDISSKDKLDSKFAECREKKHQIVPMLETAEMKKSLKTTNTTKPIRKIKGRIENYYVESILVDGKPHFLCCSISDSSLTLRQNVETEDMVYQPIDASQCGYLPYSFTSSEITELMTEKMDREQLLDGIKFETDRFISLPDIGRHLILGDILLTYCQEWINTLHYPFFVGETESGKSSALHLVKWLGYRCMLGEDIPQADVYNFLGSDEEGCGTIAEDEAQELWRNSEKIRTYKSSYSKGSVKARIIGVDSLGKHQIFYKTFCPKWFAGEILPQDKGFLERLAIVHMAEGRPQSNIKRLTNEEKERLAKLRNRLLIWKIQNIGVGIERIESGLIQRDQELWEDYLSTVQGTKYFEGCKNVVAFYVKQRHDAIQNSLEAKIFACVIDKLDENLEVQFHELWSNIITQLSGHVDKNTFYPEDYTTKISHHTLSKMLEEKFQAKRKESRTSSEKITSYLFKRGMLDTLNKKYGIKLPLDHSLYVGTHGTPDTLPSEPSVPSEPSSPSSFFDNYEQNETKNGESSDKPNVSSIDGFA